VRHCPPRSLQRRHQLKVAIQKRGITAYIQPFRGQPAPEKEEQIRRCAPYRDITFGVLAGDRYVLWIEA